MTFYSSCLYLIKETGDGHQQGEFQNRTENIQIKFL